MNKETARTFQYEFSSELVRSKAFHLSNFRLKSRINSRIGQLRRAGVNIDAQNKKGVVREQIGRVVSGNSSNPGQWSTPHSTASGRPIEVRDLSLCSPGSADKSGARKSPRKASGNQSRMRKGLSPRHRDRNESQEEISSEKLFCRKPWAYAQKIQTSKSSEKEISNMFVYTTYWSRE